MNFRNVQSSRSATAVMPSTVTAPPRPATTNFSAGWGSVVPWASGMAP